MNIVICTRFYPPDTGGGGIASYAYNQAKALKAAGHTVRVISRLTESSNTVQVTEGIQVCRISLPLAHDRLRRLPIIGRQIRFAQDMLYAREVRKTLVKVARDFQPDIVEYADIDAEGFHHPPICPYVVKLHTPHAVLRPYYSPKEIPYSLGGIENIEARTIRRANGVSSPSKWLAKEVGRLYEMDVSDIALVPNAIDTDFFSPAEHEADDSPLMVLFTGRLEPRKGAVVFAEAIPIIAKAIPGAEFIYFGADRAGSNGSSQRAALEVLFEREGLTNRVHFLGHAAPEAFRDFYRKAAVFVMPSLFENCPYTLLEAMACGKAVVVSRAGGMPEMVDDGESGLLFEAGNSVALAEATISLLQSPALRSKLGQAAREKVVQHYSLAAGTEITERFYHEVVARQSAK